MDLICRRKDDLVREYGLQDSEEPDTQIDSMLAEWIKTYIAKTDSRVQRMADRKTASRNKMNDPAEREKREARRQERKEEKLAKREMRKAENASRAEKAEKAQMARMAQKATAKGAKLTARASE